MGPLLDLRLVSEKNETVRRLNNVFQELELLAEQGNVEGFFNNVENVDQLGGLVEDIRDAVMDYQVRGYQREIASPCLTTVSDFVTTRYLRQKLSAHRENHFLVV